MGDMETKAFVVFHLYYTDQQGALASAVVTVSLSRRE